MTSTIFWEPLRNDEKRTISSILKSAFRQRYGDPIDAILDETDYDYLEGVKHGSLFCKESSQICCEVNKIIESIRKYGKIRIIERY
jgi:hypothetical protein